MSVMDLHWAELALRMEDFRNLIHSFRQEDAPGRHAPGCEACELVRKAKVACPHRLMGKAGCPDCGWKPSTVEAGSIRDGKGHQSNAPQEAPTMTTQHGQDVPTQGGKA